MTTRSPQPNSPSPETQTGMSTGGVTPGEAATAAIGVRVRYFAGARAAAGTTEETVRVVPPGAGIASVSVADVLEAALALHGDQLARVIAASGFLLDGVAVRDRNTEVGDGAQLDVLPPFAGG